MANSIMLLKLSIIISVISIGLLALYGVDIAVVMGSDNHDGFLPLNDMQRGVGLGVPAIILPIIAFFISFKQPSKKLGGLIIVSGVLILIGGITMVGTPAPEGVERNPLMLFAPAIFQIVLGAIKIKKS